MDDPSLLLQTVFEQGARISSMAELLVVYRILQNFNTRDSRVNQIERVVEDDMQKTINIIKNIEEDTIEIKKSIQEINSILHRQSGKKNSNNQNQ